jgi:hypothetical protein
LIVKMRISGLSPHFGAGGRVAAVVVTAFAARPCDLFGVRFCAACSLLARSPLSGLIQGPASTLRMISRIAVAVAERTCGSPDLRNWDAVATGSGELAMATITALTRLLATST